MIEWRPIEIRPLADGMRASPYYEWADATAFAYYSPSEWLPLLIELRASSPRLADAEAFARFVRAQQEGTDKPAAWVADVRVPKFFAEPPKRLQKPSPFIAVLARTAFIEAIRSDRELAQSIEGFELGAPTSYDDASEPEPEEPPVAGDATPKVLVAVVDDGIAFAHDRFLDDAGKTRIEFAFDQRVPLKPWFFGRELSKRHQTRGIDRRMADSQHAGIVDEDEVYRRTATVQLSRPGHKPLLARASHGSAVADLACSAVAPPPAGSRPIIVVQLPTATVADTSGATLGPQMWAALWYIVHRADQIRVGLPVVANLSYGTIAGPHDGSSLLERLMDWFIAACGSSVSVVLPAGNSRLSRCHACFSLDPGGCERLGWRVLPDDRTESQVEIWLPPGAPGLELRIIAPGGQPTNPFGWGSGQTLYVDGNPVARASYYAPGSMGSRAMVHIILAPTADPAGKLALAPAGLWTIELHHTRGSVQVRDIHAWIQRDDTAPGYPRSGRQSYFDDARYARFDDGGRAIEKDDHPLTQDSTVKRQGTLNAIATGQEPVVVGGFRRSDGAVAAYSASGPLVGAGRGLPNASGPDALLPSEEAPAIVGLLAAGTRSASVVALQGTSAAAPLATRWLASEAAAGRAFDRTALFAAAELADTDPGKPPPQLGGGGRLPQATLRRPRRRDSPQA